MHAYAIPVEQGDTMRSVRLTVAFSWGEPSSYTEKGMVNLVPTDADAVVKSHGVSPSL